MDIPSQATIDKYHTYVYTNRPSVHQVKYIRKDVVITDSGLEIGINEVTKIIVNKGGK